MSRLTTEQSYPAVGVAPTTLAGNPATIDGDVTFQSSDDAVAVVIPIDGRTARIQAVGPGVTQILASFDADLGAGVRTVTLTSALEVVLPEAVGGTIVFGTPELTPPAPTP